MATANPCVLFIFTGDFMNLLSKTATGEAFAKAVAKAGYATDPDYAAKLISIIDQHQLADLDGGT